MNPEIVIFAGPNGSGKSTFTQLLKPPMDYINADEIKKYLNCSDLEAAQIAEKQREDHMEQMREFCFETVLSTERNLILLKRAREKGYFIRCYYILTADPMINVWRVKARVESGGHDVPEDKTEHWLWLKSWSRFVIFAIYMIIQPADHFGYLRRGKN